jgi:hypothetical protein
MQRAKKQCGFALCLMQILYENTICRMVFEKIKPGIIFDLDALSWDEHATSGQLDWGYEDYRLLE